MSEGDLSTRRSFLKAGAVLSAPLAAMPGAAFASDGSTARLARFEDENAIRVLHEDWLRNINAKAANNKPLALFDAGASSSEDEIRSIAASLSGPPDKIKLGADGRSATGRFRCTIEIERPIAKNCTLAQMAYLQGGGFVRRIESRVLMVDYAKAGVSWSITRVKLVVAHV